MIQRPALAYYGGKFSLAPWIISHLPDHDTYVEPFGGGASVLLRKEPSPLEVYNDLDSQTCNFFRVVRDDAARRRLIGLLHLTPYSSEEYALAHATSGSVSDPVEAARRFFVRSWQGYGSIGCSSDHANGWRRGVSPHGRASNQEVARWLNAIPNLLDVAERLRVVQIENATADFIFARYDGLRTVFFVDPPYMRDTLSGGKGYRHDFHDESDHVALAETLHKLEGSVVLSAYHHPLYDDLYSDWEQHERPTFTVGHDAATGGRVERIEVLWVKRAGLRPWAGAAPLQPSLF